MKQSKVLMMLFKCVFLQVHSNIFLKRKKGMFKDLDVLNFSMERITKEDKSQ